MAENTTSSSKRRRNLLPEEKAMIRNVFEGLRSREKNMLVSDVVTLCASLTKISERTVYRIIKSQIEDENVSKLETRGRKTIVLDDNTKHAIRRVIYSFYLKNDIPNLKKITAALEADASIPKISRSVLLRTLEEMNFRYLNGAIENVSPQSWDKCIDHVKTEEQETCDLDPTEDVNVIEPLIIIHEYKKEEDDSDA